MEKDNAREIEYGQLRVFLKLLAFALMCVSFFVLHIWFRTKVVTKGFEVTEQRKKYSDLESRLLKAKVERNKVMGPKNLDHFVGLFSSTDRALQPPSPSQLIYVTEDGRELK